MSTTTQKLTFEFQIDTTREKLYKYISEPHRLSEWIARDVILKDGYYVFNWKEEEKKAQILDQKKNQFIRYQWEDNAEDEFLEFRIEQNEVTDDIALVITDFAPEEEAEDLEILWEQQMEYLREVVRED